MSAIGAVLPSRPRQNLREFLHRRPETAAMAVVAVAWVVLVLITAQGTRLGGLPNMSGMSGMPRAADGPGMGQISPSPPGMWSQAASALPFWVLMAIAMMGPAALAGVRHTAVNSLSWRRRRAMTEFCAAYLLVWAAFGFLALAGTMRLPTAGQVPVLGAVLTAAAAWELTSFKRRALRGCHRSVPLPPRGWRAEAGAVRFGLRNGGACLGSCWCLMLVMTVAPAGQLLWTIALTVIMTAEKLRQRPRLITEAAAAALAIAALAALAATAAA